VPDAKNLMKSIENNKILVSTMMDIDLIWHTHQTISSDSYYRWCLTSIGRLIDHDDTIPGEDLQKGYTRTFIYWSRAYHEPYSNHPPDHSAWQKNHKFTWSPFGLYREFQWKRHTSTSRPIQGVPTVVVDSPHTINPKCVIATPVYDSTYRPDNNLTTNIVPVFSAPRKFSPHNYHLFYRHYYALILTEILPTVAI